MARAPRQLKDGTLWVGQRVEAIHYSAGPVGTGTVTRVSDGRHIAMWVRLDCNGEEHLFYDHQLTLLEIGK